MKILADESCAGPIIFALRQASLGVLAIAEVEKRAVDERVIERALSERCVLITEDRDFGDLVYGHGRQSAGVIFVKFHSRARHAKPTAVVEAVAKLGVRLQDAFVVVEPGRVRIGRRPQG